MLFQTCKTSFHLRNTNSDIVYEFRALSVPPIDSKDPYTIKVQKQSNVLCQHHAHVYAQIKAHISKMAPGWSGGDKLLNKCVIFVFFAHKKYSHSFKTLWLNHWCHVNYYNDVLAMFLDLERGSSLAVYAGQNSLRFHQKYLNLWSEDEQWS